MKEDWATTTEVLTRLLVAITPLVPILVKLIKDLFRRGTPTDPAKAPTPEQVASGGTLPRRLSDLSLALAYSAIFSLLWACAIGVSGQLPSWSSLVLISLVLTLFLTALLVLSWRRDRFSLSLAALAALSLLVVGLTRGGPFFPGEGGEEAMSATMPLLILFVILASLLLYLRTRWSLWLPRLSTKRWVIPLTLAAGGALVAAAGGVEYTRGLYESQKTLHVTNDQARDLLLTLNGGSIQLRRLFYQLGSEILLAPFYQQQYLALQPAGSTGNPGASIEEDDSSLSEGEFMAMLDSEPAGDGRQCLVSESFVQAVKHGSPETYMANRLRWVHPLGDGKKAKVGIPLPGRTAEDRLRETAKHRIYKSLEGQEKRRASLLATCTYPADLRRALSGRERTSPLEVLNPLGSGEEFKPQEGILPEFEPHNGNSILEFQMALPVAEESRTAFAQYREIGLALEGNPQFQQLAIRFETLEADVQSAFNQYLGDPATRLKHYELLTDLADVPSSFEDNFDPMTAVGTLEVMLPNNLSGTGPRTEAFKPSQPAADSSDPGAEAGQGTADTTSILPEQHGEDVEALGAALISHLKLIDKIAVREGILRDLRSLLKQNDPAIPVIHLLRRQSLDFVREIYKQGMASKDVDRLLEICSRPVVPTIRRILQKSALVPQSDRKDLESALDTFALLSADDQEAVLHLAANQFYRIQEPDELLSLGVANAGIYGRHLDVLAATVYFLPIVLLAIWTGMYFSRVLTARDVLRSSIAQESKRGESSLPTFALGAHVIGREPVLRQLSNLARRGWGTIALVGQRGIGKTRILQEVINGSGDGQEGYIGVWITAPARFDEREFVTSTLEQVSTQVERTVAQYLGAQPLAVRELESRLKWGWLVHLAVLMLVFNVLLAEIESTLSEPMLVLALTPTFLVILGALCVGVYYWSRLQPVDLTSWLQERQSTHAQAALMYREAVEVVQASREVGLRAISPAQRQVRAYQRGLLWSLGLLEVLITVSYLVQPTAVEGFLILFLSILWLWIFSRRHVLPRASDDSLMSLLRRYREYVSNVVRRLDMGALGHKKGKGVVVCIDELDKIVNLEEIKEVVRRIKGIFEVPGVYYHISLAEDTFSALYLGSVEGKNEIDSSFDHIVRIMPLSAAEASELVQAQLKRIEIAPGDARTSRAIAAVSFGNPRDALGAVS